MSKSDMFDEFEVWRESFLIMLLIKSELDF